LNWAYVFVITRKFAWTICLVFRTCLDWESHRMLSSTDRGGYWKRLIVVFQSQFNITITIISAYRVECGLLDTEIQPS